VGHPILQELARHRSTYLRLYSALNLPELDEDGNTVEETIIRAYGLK